jgi:thiosulfate/3-mercaptopyruvate sulfurtransferase
MYTTLVSTPQLQALLASNKPCMVFDCSSDLMQAESGQAMYQEVHIAGAVYADLNRVLSVKGGTTLTGAASGGRHPLPSREQFAQWLGSIGFSNSMQAVVYDRQGVNYCGRLWWMLKWLGHEAVAVLDGGLQTWQAAGGAIQTGPTTEHAPGVFNLMEPMATLVDVDTVERNLGRSHQTLVDARAKPRFKGEVEPLDPIAGHIPGALNRPFTQNLGPDGLFKTATVLRAEFDALLGLRKPGTVVHHCGSGVSAVPNILAMEIAGLGRTGLFAGSWSEWCSNPERPVAQG